MSAGEKKARCAEIAPMLVFYACDEVNERERQADRRAPGGVCVLHASNWPTNAHCGKRLARRTGPAKENSTPRMCCWRRCRSELAEKLDDLTFARRRLQEHWQPFGWVRRWMALRPAWSGAMLVFFGVLLGAEVIPWLQSGVPGNNNGRAVNVMASQKLTDEQLSKMAVAGINLSPSPNAAAGHGATATARGAADGAFRQRGRQRDAPGA